MRLIIGVDPGLGGAVGFLADGTFSGVFDMPRMPRQYGDKEEVDGQRLAAIIRSELARHPGADVVAAVEHVGARPDEAQVRAFRFGESLGVVKGVLGALRIPMVSVTPQKWKGHLRLTGHEKDVARGQALHYFPETQDHLKRKKDCGRAEALLIALWAHLTEAAPTRRVA